MAESVLITGSSGTIGTVLANALADDYTVRGVDRRAPNTKGTTVATTLADMTDLGAVESAFEGADVVIDLAARTSQYLDWDPAYENNYAATRNAFEAANRVGARRLIFASSNHAVGNFEMDSPYKEIVEGDYSGLKPGQFERVDENCPIRPDGAYGIGKALGESIGRYYSDVHGLSVMCLRIGTVNPQDLPLTVRNMATFLFHKDLIQLVRRCIEAPPSARFGIYYGVSNNRWRFWDLANAERDIGYVPTEDAERFRGDVS
jgi:nucleoside-diphosphate-sugar epimerase